METCTSRLCHLSRAAALDNLLVCRHFLHPITARIIPHTVSASIEVVHQERVRFKKSAVMASHADSAHDLLDLDIGTLRQYVELFPTEGLAKVITGYLSSGISKYPLTQEKEKDAPDLSEGGVSLSVDVPVSQDDCLALMTVSSSNDSNVESCTCCTNHDPRKAFWKPGNHHLPTSY